jgi:hypothetical protein
VAVVAEVAGVAVVAEMAGVVLSNVVVAWLWWPR